MSYSDLVKLNTRNILDELRLRARKSCSQVREKFSTKSKNYVLRNLFEYLAQTILVRVESLIEEVEKVEKRVLKRIDRYGQRRRDLHASSLEDVNKKFEILRNAYINNSNNNNEQVLREKHRVDALKVCEELVLKLAYLSERYLRNDDEETRTRKDKPEQAFNSLLLRCHVYRMRAISKVIFSAIFKIILNIFHPKFGIMTLNMG